jgi:hypothetical protein
LEYGRGPEKTWVYGALRVGDGHEVTMTAPSRHSVNYQRFLGLVEQANPAGTIMVITDNLSSHTSSSTRTWLADHPRIQHAFIPKRACWLNLQEGWWRRFRREALAGETFADPGEITLATRVATCRLNARARPWVWAAHHRSHAAAAAPSPTGFSERSTKALIRLLGRACIRHQEVAASPPWLATLSTTPLGSLTKKRRTPHGSSVSGCTSARPRRRASAWTASTSATSTEICGTTGAEASSRTTAVWSNDLVAARHNHPLDVLASPLDWRAYLVCGRRGRTGRLSRTRRISRRAAGSGTGRPLGARDHAVLDPARLVLAQLRLGLDRRRADPEGNRLVRDPPCVGQRIPAQLPRVVLDGLEVLGRALEDGERLPALQDLGESRGRARR